MFLLWISVKGSIAAVACFEDFSPHAAQAMDTAHSGSPSLCTTCETSFLVCVHIRSTTAATQIIDSAGHAVGASCKLPISRPSRSGRNAQACAPPPGVEHAYGAPSGSVATGASAASAAAAGSLQVVVAAAQLPDAAAAAASSASADIFSRCGSSSSTP